MTEHRTKYIIPQAPPWPETVQLAVEALRRNTVIPPAERKTAEEKLAAAMAASIEHWGAKSCQPR